MAGKARAKSASRKGKPSRSAGGRSAKGPKARSAAGRSVMEVPLGPEARPHRIVLDGTARRGSKSVAVDDSTSSAASLKAYKFKSTFNTSDIMHSPVEKTLKMLEKIIAGDRLFTM